MLSIRFYTIARILIKFDMMSSSLRRFEALETLPEFWKPKKNNSVLLISQ
jgi:hypothetical protein